MNPKMRVTILGSGGSLGVPAAGGFWGDCDPHNPKNERTRASLFVQSENTNILVDATADVRTQLNRLGKIDKLDGLILSHAHSDHISGMDDLRVLSYAGGGTLQMYANYETVEELKVRFDYIFQGGFGGLYKPFMTANVVDYGPHRIGDIRMDLFEQDHTSCSTIGVRINDFAYSVDMAALDDKAQEKLKGVDTWVVDAGGYKREKVSTHATVDRIMYYAEKLGIRQTYLSVLTGAMDYNTLCRELPEHIRPAYDGMELEI